MYLFFVRQETPLSPRAVRRSAAEHRTDHEEASCLMEIQWLPGINLVVSDWTKEGGLGSPRRFFGDFLCVQKVTRVRAGEARELKSEAAGFGCPRGPGAQPPLKGTGFGAGEAPIASPR